MALHNAAPFVKEAVDSVLAQDFGDFELIVCNDGSTDDGARIVANIAKKDERVRLLSNAKNRGYTPTMNRLFNEARGEYIAIMDADDISLPTRFSKQVAVLGERPDMGVVSTEYLALYPDGSTEPAKTAKFVFNDHRIRSWMTFVGSVLCNPTVMIRGKALGDLRYEEYVAYAPDYLLAVRLLPYTKFGTLNEPLLLYRRHEQQMSDATYAKQSRDAAKVQLAALRQAGVSELGADAVDAIGALCLANLGGDLGGVSYTPKPLVPVVRRALRGGDFYGYNGVHSVAKKRLLKLYFQLLFHYYGGSYLRTGLVFVRTIGLRGLGFTATSFFRRPIVYLKRIVKVRR